MFDPLEKREHLAADGIDPIGAVLRWERCEFTVKAIPFEGSCVLKPLPILAVKV
jgi:hypothetical protein